jgi:hypothetical protein
MRKSDGAKVKDTTVAAQSARLHTLLPHTGGGQAAAPHRSRFASNRVGLGLFIAALLLFASAFANAAWVSGCWAASDTGKVIGDFTLDYASIGLDGVTVTPLATTGIALTEIGDGCYIFRGIADSNLLNYYFRATLTSTGDYHAWRRPQGGAAQNVAWTNVTELVPTAYTYKRHDRAPNLQLLVKRLSAIPTGTLVFSMTPSGGSTAKVSRQAATYCGTGSGCAYVANSDGTYNAYFIYAWGATDLDMANTECTSTMATCSYNAEFEMTTAGVKQTFTLPTQIRVTRDLDDN